MTTAQFLRNMLLAALAFALTFVVACGEDTGGSNGPGMVDDNNNGIPDNNGHDNIVIPDNNGGYVPGFSATVHVTIPEEMLGSDVRVQILNTTSGICQGQSECDLQTNFQGENIVYLQKPFWMAIGKHIMVDKNGMTAEVTWDNEETPGQYGLAPVGTYKDPLDHTFVVDFQAEVLTYNGLTAVVLGSRAHLPSGVVSGNHFEWLGAEAPASFTGTISDDLRVIEYRQFNGEDEFFRTLEIVGDPIDPVTGQPYKKNP